MRRKHVDGYVVFAGNMGVQSSWTSVIRNWAGLQSANRPVLYAGTAHSAYGDIKDSQVAFLPGKDFPWNHAFDFAYMWRPQRARRLQG